MIRPLTCLSLVAALGAGLYLYQEKHRAQLLDRDINRTVKQAEQSRERIGLLRAEWALLNEPERLAGLAAQHLQLQPLQPTQFVRLDDLPSRLPAIAMTPVPPLPMDEPPVAAVVPAQPIRTLMASAQPAPIAAPAAPARVQAPSLPVAGPARPAPLLAAAALAPVVTAKPASLTPSPIPASPVQLAAAHPGPRPAPAHTVPAAKPAEPEQVARAPEPERRRLFAPVMPAYAPTPVMVHAPTVQTASAMGAPAPSFVGSALGMARTVLAAPVPVASAAMLGLTSER